MKRVFSLSVCVLVLLTFFVVKDSEAYNNYGGAVDTFCLDSNPFNGDCSLCHTSDRKVTTPEITSYQDGKLCDFCSNDTNCLVLPTCTDSDNDSYYAEAGCGSPVDCNDSNSAVNPGVSEICGDSVDNNCDGDIDAQDPICGTPVICTDDDGDGYSAEGGDCGPADCSDSDYSIYPGAEDICSDGIDQDCSGKDRTKGAGCSTKGKKREGKGRTCSDGLDNDEDGLVDCADNQCSRNRACRP
jgi:hypothetical protein